MLLKMGWKGLINPASCTSFDPLCPYQDFALDQLDALFLTNKLKFLKCSAGLL